MTSMTSSMDMEPQWSMVQKQYLILFGWKYVMLLHRHLSLHNLINQQLDSVGYGHRTC